MVMQMKMTDEQIDRLVPPLSDSFKPKCSVCRVPYRDDGRCPKCGNLSFGMIVG
jgi:tRNA(Ile2) C34 agmatinyltransferase TiaS